MNRERALQVVLTVVGLAFIFGIYTFIIIWPSGWSWHTGQSHQLPHYLQMILVVYATLGVFLLMASRHPAEHRSLIAFAAWSSIVHGAIMGLEAFETVGEQGHLLGDVPALLIIGIVLIALAPPKPVAPAVALAPAKTYGD
jgi:hydrogenase/urease accessory protein HupE